MKRYEVTVQQIISILDRVQLPEVVDPAGEPTVIKIDRRKGLHNIIIKLIDTENTKDTREIEYVAPEQRGQVPGAAHAADQETMWTQYNLPIAATMRNYWINFVKTGNPNGKELSLCWQVLWQILYLP